MKIRICFVLIILCSLLMTGSAAWGKQMSNVLYVRPAASGTEDCYSWENACTLQTALHRNDGSNEIWVTEGVYTPATGNNSYITFLLRNSVAMYGGFVGYETDREQRNWQEHETILSGDIGVTGDNSDNSYHVVTCLNGDAGTILDGFTIADGNANASSYHNERGAGMKNWLGSPMLTNVIFSNNSAEFSGGGMYNYSSGNPTLVNVTFNNNIAGYNGGGMYNEESNPILKSVTFSNNSAVGFGGGMANDGGSPMLIDVTFSDNSAEIDGGGMGNDGGSPTLTNVTFSNNSAEGVGGGMHNKESSPTLTEVTFSENSADYAGGMYNLRGSPTLTNVIFSDNSVEFSGGGMYNNESNPSLADSTFDGNSAGRYGGGVYDDRSSPSLMGVTFIGNSAKRSGGGIFNYFGNPTLANVTFSVNHAGHHGGGMHSRYGDSILAQVTFINNTADSGGGLDILNGNATLVDTTFIGNRATSLIGGGGGIYYGGDLTLTEGTFIDNSAQSDGGGIYNTYGTQTLTDVTFGGNSAQVRGGGIYNYNGTQTLTNVTFSANSAGYGGGMANFRGSSTLMNVSFSGNSARYGGGMYNYDSSPILSNCILWGNTTSQIFSNNLPSTITYSDIQGSYPGTGNINANPLFVDADGPDNIPGTSDDDLRLRVLSPAIDAGDNSAVPSDITTDLGGMPRFADVPWMPDTGEGVPPIVDMGAYERPAQDTESVVAVSDSAGDTSVRLEEGLNRVDWHLVRLGQSNVAVDGFTYVNGFRFEDMNIPQGATIVNAQLMLRYADWSQGLPVTLTLHAEASNHAPDFSNENPLASERALTTASTLWTIAEVPEGWFDSPDLAPLVQEVVNRPGWQPGNALALLVDGVAADELRHYVDVLAYDMDPAAGARLYVFYTLPEPTPTSTPSPTLTPTPTATLTPNITPTPTITPNPESKPLYLPLIF